MTEKCFSLISTITLLSSILIDNIYPLILLIYLVVIKTSIQNYAKAVYLINEKLPYADFAYKAWALLFACRGKVRLGLFCFEEDTDGSRERTGTFVTLNWLALEYYGWPVGLTKGENWNMSVRAYCYYLSSLAACRNREWRGWRYAQTRWFLKLHSVLLINRSPKSLPPVAMLTCLQLSILHSTFSAFVARQLQAVRRFQAATPQPKNPNGSKTWSRDRSCSRLRFDSPYGLPCLRCHSTSVRHKVCIP